MAGRKGFGPSIFSVTGRRVNRATPPAHFEVQKYYYTLVRAVFFISL